MANRKLVIDRKSATDWLACVGHQVKLSVEVENGTGNMHAHVEGDRTYVAGAVVQKVTVGTEECIVEIEMDALRDVDDVSQNVDDAIEDAERAAAAGDDGAA